LKQCDILDMFNSKIKQVNDYYQNYDETTQSRPFKEFNFKDVLTFIQKFLACNMDSFVFDLKKLFNIVAVYSDITGLVYISHDEKWIAKTMTQFVCESLKRFGSVCLSSYEFTALRTLESYHIKQSLHESDVHAILKRYCVLLISFGLKPYSEGYTDDFILEPFGSDDLLEACKGGKQLYHKISKVYQQLKQNDKENDFTQSKEFKVIKTCIEDVCRKNSWYIDETIMSMMSTDRNFRNHMEMMKSLLQKQYFEKENGYEDLLKKEANDMKQHVMEDALLEEQDEQEDIQRERESYDGGSQHQNDGSHQNKKEIKKKIEARRRERDRNNRIERKKKEILRRQKFCKDSNEMNGNLINVYSDSYSPDENKDSDNVSSNERGFYNQSPEHDFSTMKNVGGIDLKSH